MNKSLPYKYDHRHQRTRQFPHLQTKASRYVLFERRFRMLLYHPICPSQRVCFVPNPLEYTFHLSFSPWDAYFGLRPADAASHVSAVSRTIVKLLARSSMRIPSASPYIDLSFTSRIIVTMTKLGTPMQSILLQIRRGANGALDVWSRGTALRKP